METVNAACLAFVEAWEKANGPLTYTPENVRALETSCQCALREAGLVSRNLPAVVANYDRRTHHLQMEVWIPGGV